MKYKIIPFSERYDLFEKQDSICSEVWPEFMLHDPVADEYWMQFIETFKHTQVMIMEDDEIVAVFNSVPIHYEGKLEDLPEDGWDWAVKKSITDYKKNLKPNILVGLQIVVNKHHQGKGLSSIAVKEMAALAKREGYENLVIPVRPSDKHKYPLLAMENYIKWNNDKKLPYDNWLRVHIKAGGKIIKVCKQAMYIPGTVDEWKEWSGLDFQDSGNYIIPGALNPVKVDLDRNLVEYIEPNVWIQHKT